jgi:hypothetical protein
MKQETKTSHPHSKEEGLPSQANQLGIKLGSELGQNDQYIV